VVKRTGPLDTKAALLADTAADFAFDLKQRRHYHLADQLERAASAVGASIAEARGVLTRKHFSSKLQHALSECHEVKYWLDRISHKGFANNHKFQEVSGLQLEMIKMLTSACVKLSEPKNEIKSVKTGDETSEPKA